MPSPGDERGHIGPNFIDRTGQRYGRLVVIERAETKYVSGKPRLHWLCRCDCGNETPVWSWSLSRGATRSCGCLRGNGGVSGPRLAPGRYARNQVCKDYRVSARRRGLCWELTDDDFDRLTSQACFYCGLQPSTVAVKKRSEFLYSGIDRKDSSLGYTPANTVPCCETCNRAKRAMPYDEFMAWIARLIEFARPNFR
jgi:hypothetical protein